MRLTTAGCAVLPIVIPIGLALAPAPAIAQVAMEAPAAAPSSNAMVNLVRLLVAQGTISRDKGDELIAEALREADQARRTEALATAASLASQRGMAASASGSPAGGASAAGEVAAALPPPAAGTIRVPYIPQVVRDQIRDEIRADVLREAKEGGWSSPGTAAPEWVRNVKLYGDLRIRSQSQLYSRFNSDLEPNFQAIVNSGPLDLLSGAIPFLNITQNRYNLWNLRARLGADIQVSPGFRAGIELATGNSAAPNSTSTTLGNGLFKRNIFLNKAFLQATIANNYTLTVGRMDRPFFYTDAMFSNDLRFDGLAAEWSLPNRFYGAVDLTLRGGAFPLDFGNTNFPDASTTKARVRQKWLFAGQVEGNIHFDEDTELKLAAGYYFYRNITGKPSAPCPLGFGATQCSTDGTAAFFVQKGNTLFQVRDIVDSTGQSVNGPQLLGLAQKFHIVDAIAQLKMPIGEQSEVVVTGEFLRNLAFRRSVCRYGLAFEPVNNGGAGGSGDICDPIVANRTPYVGGGTGFQFTAAFGNPAPKRWGEWRAFAGYKYLQSDVVLDAFNDDAFHLGGTNAKGYTIGATVGLVPGVSFTTRWLSANEVSGAPMAIDVLQAELNAAF